MADITGNVIYTNIQDYGVAVCFDYIEDETATIEASITDNFVESNFSVQDHIAIKPRIYRLRGYIGEIVYKKINDDDTWAKRIGETIQNSNFVSKHSVAQKTITGLKIANVVSPIVGNYTKTAKNVVNQLQASFDRYVQMWDNYKGDIPLRGQKQITASSVLTYMLENRIPVHLEGLAHRYDLPEAKEDTGIEKRYYIQSVSAHQGNNKYVSDFEVTLKEFRIAKRIITEINKKQYAHDISTQKTITANNGTANTQKIDPKPIVTAGGKAVENTLNAMGNEVKNAYIGSGIKLLNFGMKLGTLGQK